jgi:hypothetical protein
MKSIILAKRRMKDTGCVAHLPLGFQLFYEIIQFVFQKSEEGRLRRAMEGVNSSMIYLIYCKNLCK